MVFAGMKAWDALGDDLKAAVSEIVRATSADASAYFVYRDMPLKKKFVEEMGGELTQLDANTIADLQRYYLEVVDDFSAKDPKYCGRVGEMLHEYQRLRGS
ncbi:hypothetical protein Q5Y75_08705 [Ruegeria sp. 2205SS24-7]|uniref:hypothetical protein n=1 Tax=Ruegeria discodermiae TaxID=3064389 RepID=UPI0027412729|nr:hypothetical protein [Ruegeria sp. 2205SS24-7]MDP5217293.1 hypothetical protein [Ruegeria sp. 2205SS24-7]